MAHHGDDPSIFNKKFRELLEDQQLNQLGPTGRFPDGQLNDNDEGEIQIAINTEGGKVVINFGKPVAWIGFTPEQADMIAFSLIEKASKLKGRR